MLLKILLHNLVLTSGSSNGVGSTCVLVLSGRHHHDIALSNTGRLTERKKNISNVVGMKERNVRTDI